MAEPNTHDRPVSLVSSVRLSPIPRTNTTTATTSPVDRFRPRPAKTDKLPEAAPTRSSLEICAWSRSSGEAGTDVIVI
ncbi:hypothetical protein PENPOL_c005G09015 [Penicillium polonicum]|uniref:Uncharacterized protein n=1 Tax=Penicillium polonicum TaxID=60169 RepID=A0A1V6NM57_PENPO|nr:hypothetical protein PENPOL_c005G09015 [Penicillium polonicum]